MNWSLLSYYFTGDLSWLQDVYKTLPSILYAILAIVGGAGMVYSIVLGVNLAKSENEEKRRYAVYRMRNTLIGVGVLLIIVLVINLALPAILQRAFPNDVFKSYEEYTSKWVDPYQPQPEESALIRPILSNIKSFITRF